jgi:hypothetical protein
MWMCGHSKEAGVVKSMRSSWWQSIPEQVTVLDPLVGERRLPRDDFQAIWAATRFLTLVITM